MKSNKSITKNSIFYLIYNVLNVIFPFLTGMYVTHILLPDDIGLVEMAKNFVQYFVILSFLGIPTYGLREISKNRNDKAKLSKIYSELMLINCISTLIFSAIYLLLIFSIHRCYENINLYLIVGISLVLNLFNNSWLYEGLEEFKYISLRNLAIKIISFVALIIIVRNENDYLMYASITVIGTAGNYILNIINAKKFVKFTLKNLDLKCHLGSIMYLVVVNLAIEIYSLIDVTMLGIFCENKKVAYYSYGIKIYKILLQVVNSFTMVLVPKISLYLKENKMNEFKELILKALKVIFILTIPMIVGIMFTSDTLITKIYGFGYIESSYVLKITSFILLISPVGYLLGSRILLVSGNEKKMIIPVVYGAICNVIGNYILIQKYSEIGAAIASVISEFVVMIIYINLGKKYFGKLDIKENLIKVTISTCIMSIFLIVIGNYINSSFLKTVIAILISIILYFIALLILKENFTYTFFKEKILNRLNRRKFEHE